MGYYAEGEGSVLLKNEVDVNVMEEIVEKILEDIDNDDIEYSFDGKVMDFWENNTHWDETETYQFLNALTPYITDGHATYSGDEDCHWKYTFNGEKDSWDEQYGRVVFDLSNFTDDELVEELSKRGYDVSKEEELSL